jgi:hypothetical protein
MKMTATAAETVSARKIVKMILPKEHGSWSLALEPVVFGLLVAFSAAGVALAMAAVAGFFIRRPLKIAFREDEPERRKIACAAIFIFGAIAFAGLSLAAKIAGVEKLWPLFPAALAGLIFAGFDLRNEARAEAAELSGAIAFAILPAAFASLAGWKFFAATALALVMLSRSVPTVLLVRAYLRRAKHRPSTMTPSVVAAIAAFVLVFLLALFRVAPWIVAGFFFLMAGWTVYLATCRARFAAKTIGIVEAIFGAAVVLGSALGWKFI